MQVFIHTQRAHHCVQSPCYPMHRFDLQLLMGLMGYAVGTSGFHQGPVLFVN